MSPRFFLAVSALGLWATACAVNPLTPTPLPTETLPPVIVRVATGTANAPPTPTVPLATSTLSIAARVEPTDLLPTIEVVFESPTEAPLVVQQIQATLPPAPAATAAPPVATAVPPVQVAPPPSADVAAAEQYCIDLINVQRANAGVPPLLRDEIVMGIARARVADMVARGYTGHNDPATGVALGASMLRAAGFGTYVGENWYGTINGPPAIVDIAMGWFMTDPPHYRNILSPNYTYVGVGIAYNGRQWLLIQNFAGS